MKHYAPPTGMNFIEYLSVAHQTPKFDILILNKWYQNRSNGDILLQILTIQYLTISRVLLFMCMGGSRPIKLWEGAG